MKPLYSFGSITLIFSVPQIGMFDPYFCYYDTYPSASTGTFEPRWPRPRSFNAISKVQVFLNIVGKDKNGTDRTQGEGCTCRSFNLVFPDNLQFPFSLISSLYQLLHFFFFPHVVGWAEAGLELGKAWRTALGKESSRPLSWTKLPLRQAWTNTQPTSPMALLMQNGY